VWIAIFIAGIALFIAGVVGLFWGLATVEGFASVVMLVAGWGVLRLTSNPTHQPKRRDASDNIILALGIGFFALMGMAIDQPGNALYNQPLEWLFCPDGTSLTRGEEVRNPRPGTTTITQEFACLNHDGQVVEQISMGYVILVRLGEYVLIGYALVYLSRAYDWAKRRWLRPSEAL
jgi:hypothetical protein